MCKASKLGMCRTIFFVFLYTSTFTACVKHHTNVASTISCSTGLNETARSEVQDLSWKLCSVNIPHYWKSNSSYPTRYQTDSVYIITSYFSEMHFVLHFIYRRVLRRRLTWIRLNNFVCMFSAHSSSSVNHCNFFKFTSDDIIKYVILFVSFLSRNS